MKNGILLKLAVFIGLCVTNQALPWTLALTNWSRDLHDYEAEFGGCSNNRGYVPVGGTVHINAKECLLTGIKLHNTSQKPYKSHGQRTHQHFYIIGPIDGYFRIGRLEPH